MIPLSIFCIVAGVFFLFGSIIHSDGGYDENPRRRRQVWSLYAAGGGLVTAGFTIFAAVAFS